MNEIDLEGLRALMRQAVAKAIENQVAYIILYLDNGLGSAGLCKVSDLKEVLADNPTKEFVILCTVNANGDIQPSTGDERLKHIKG